MSRVLVCVPEVPNPRISGGYGRNVAIVRALQRLGHQPVVLALSSRRDDGTSSMLADEGIPVVALDRGTNTFADIVRSGFSTIFLTYYELAEQLLPAIRVLAPQGKIVIDSVDVHYVRMLRQAQIEGDPNASIRAEAVRRRELAVYVQADVLLSVSEHEQELLSELTPGVPVGVVPSVHTAQADVPGPAGRRGALFVGAYNFAPNLDAAVHLCREVLPRLRALGYEEPVSLVGPYLDDPLAALARQHGAEPIGFVRDLSGLYRERRVFISPVRFGSGVKTKVGEALGAGLPVIGTTMGTEGFPDHDCLVRSDDPETLAREVIALGDDELWTRRSGLGRQLIREYYSPERCERELTEVFDYLATRRMAAA